jgi:hypothetical protein
MHSKQEILIFKSIVFSMLLVFFISCGKKEVKEVSEESLMAQEAFQLAETIKQAYLDNDRKALERNATQDGYRELVGEIKSFDSAELEFVPTWVEIDDTVVKLTVSWKGTWIVSDFTKEDRGIVVFVMEGQPLKVAQVLRASPFRQPE